MKKIQFLAGEGRHLQGSVNYLISDDGLVYAEVQVPEGASEDYGYLTMVKALGAAKAAGYTFWYDGQEANLEADADADCEVYTDVETGASVDFAAAVELMDDELREELSRDLAPCSEQDFLQAYAAAHLAKYGQEWEPAKDNPTW